MNKNWRGMYALQCLDKKFLSLTISCKFVNGYLMNSTVMAETSDAFQWKLTMQPDKRKQMKTMREGVLKGVTLHRRAKVRAPKL